MSIRARLSSSLLAGALAAAALLALPASGAAQPACSGTGEHLMSWPDAAPVWQFCWLRPQDSSGHSGSGLEIRDVHYNGHLVLKRGHVPMLNVQYVPGGCGCYRDWQDQQVIFQADNIITQGVYAEPDVPAQTVCDTGGSGGDIGSFNGVAAEKFADPLVMTTQFQAGWYRYTMKWKFWMDGRIQPVFGFAAVDASCVSFTHRHHAYWRLDFDIDNAENDIVTEGPDPATGGGGGAGRPGPRPQIQVLATEGMRRNNQPNLTWSVIDSGTHRGYRIVPGTETELPADAFSQGDLWALVYHDNEIDDGHTIGQGTCEVDFSPWLNDEALFGDVVVWYRTGANHLGGDIDDCHIVGPTLVPIGDWSVGGGPH
jgi:hypothetical protein